MWFFEVAFQKRHNQRYVKNKYQSKVNTIKVLSIQNSELQQTNKRCDESGLMG